VEVFKVKYTEKESIERFTRKIVDKDLRYIVRQMMDFYYRAARRNRWAFLIMTIMVIMINASIPVLTSLDKKIPSPTTLIAVLSAVATVINGIVLVLMLKEGWIRSRTSLERFKRELVLFGVGHKPYDKGDKERLLAKRVNKITSDEYDMWINALNEQDVDGSEDESKRYQRSLDDKMAKIDKVTKDYENAMLAAKELEQAQVSDEEKEAAAKVVEAKKVELNGMVDKYKLELEEATSVFGRMQTLIDSSKSLVENNDDQ